MWRNWSLTKWTLSIEKINLFLLLFMSWCLQWYVIYSVIRKQSSLWSLAGEFHVPFLEKSSVFKVRIFYQLYVDTTTQLQTIAMRTCGDLDKSRQSKSYDILWLLNIKKQFFKTNILWAELNRPETDVSQGLPVSTLWGNLSPPRFSIQVFCLMPRYQPEVWTGR